MQTYGGHLKLEAFLNLGSNLLEELTEEITLLRKAGDYSQEAMEACRVDEIIKTHTGIKTVTYVNDQVGMNAFARIPSMDSNHPFFTQTGIAPWFTADTAIAKLDDGPLSGTVDIKRYKVSGLFSKIECPIVIGHQLIKDKSFTNEEITEILCHEVGHHFTYFELLGNLVRDSWLISNASKAAIGINDIEIRRKVLMRTQEQLGITPLNMDTLLTSAEATRKESVQMVLVTNSALKTTTNSSTPLYDYRTVEQIADAFVVHHGGGRHLASALVKFSKQRNIFGFRGLASRDNATYVVLELIKTLWTLAMFFSIPITTVIWLISMAPATKRYDDPEMRVNTLKQQVVSMLRQAKTEEDKKDLSDQIKALDLSLKELKDKRTVYTMIYDAITPIGRKSHNEEKFREDIKTILFNEFQAKALEMRN